MNRDTDRLLIHLYISIDKSLANRFSKIIVIITNSYYISADINKTKKKEKKESVHESNPNLKESISIQSLITSFSSPSATVPLRKRQNREREREIDALGSGTRRADLVTYVRGKGKRDDAAGIGAPLIMSAVRSAHTHTPFPTAAARM